MRHFNLKYDAVQKFYLTRSKLRITLRTKNKSWLTLLFRQFNGLSSTEVFTILAIKGIESVKYLSIKFGLSVIAEDIVEQKKILSSKVYHRNTY